MRQIEPESGSTESHAAETEQSLRRENELLKRQLHELSNHGHAAPAQKVWRPSAITIWALFLASAVLLAIGFVAGYLPLQKRQNLIRAEATAQEQALPRAEVIQVGRSSHSSQIELPGSVQPITEAPVLARATGYIKTRLADIGDRVKTAQPLAEIEAPELDAQVRQAKATLLQAQAALDQAQANLAQGKSEMEFARVTAERWSHLLARGVVSRQETDAYQTQYQSRAAAVQALEKAIGVQRSNITATEANLARLEEMQSYLVVKAPFDGVITLRNIDAGALVNAGSTLLFRIAQTGVVRIYVNVPQANAGSVRPGQSATLRVSNIPGRTFSGVVDRMSNALDPSSRTMLVEVHARNPDGALLPGMYAQVDLSSARANPPLLIPSDALVVRPEGLSVALVRSGNTVHLQRVEVGRDYGDRLEITTGLKEGDTIIANPGDLAREGERIEPVTTDRN